MASDMIFRFDERTLSRSYWSRLPLAWLVGLLLFAGVCLGFKGISGQSPSAPAATRHVDAKPIVDVRVGSGCWRRTRNVATKGGDKKNRSIEPIPPRGGSFRCESKSPTGVSSTSIFFGRRRGWNSSEPAWAAASISTCRRWERPARPRCFRSGLARQSPSGLRIAIAW